MKTAFNHTRFFFPSRHLDRSHAWILRSSRPSALHRLRQGDCTVLSTCITTLKRPWVLCIVCHGSLEWGTCTHANYFLKVKAWRDPDLLIRRRKKVSFPRKKASRELFLAHCAVILKYTTSKIRLSHSRTTAAIPFGVQFVFRLFF